MSWIDQLKGIWGNKLPVAPSSVKALVRKEFGLTVKNESFYIEALTHSSMLDGDTTGRRSNERLEFLGDVALDLSVASELFNEFPDEQEGGLTQRKSKVVNRRTLNLLGERMGIPALIEAKMRREDVRDAIVGNAVEALIGAVFLDHGYKKTSKAVVRLLKRHGAYDKVHSREDFKSQLHKWASQRRSNLEFRIIAEEMERGETVYTIAAIVNGKELGRGEGTSKKVAEQSAARHAWKRVYIETESETGAGTETGAGSETGSRTGPARSRARGSGSRARGGGPRPRRKPADSSPEAKSGEKGDVHSQETNKSDRKPRPPRKPRSAQGSSEGSGEGEKKEAPKSRRKPRRRPSGDKGGQENS